MDRDFNPHEMVTLRARVIDWNCLTASSSALAADLAERAKRTDNLYQSSFMELAAGSVENGLKELTLAMLERSTPPLPELVKSGDVEAEQQVQVKAGVFVSLFTTLNEVARNIQKSPDLALDSGNGPNFAKLLAAHDAFLPQAQSITRMFEER